MRISAAILLVLLWSFPLTAGGTSATASVIDFARVSETVTTFTLRFSEPFGGLPPGTVERCQEIKIQAEFRPGWWPWSRNWSRDGQVNRETHADALAVIETAHVTKQTIEFGIMGTGLRERGTTCIFDTLGLAVWRLDQERRPIIAYHDSY